MLNQLSLLPKARVLVVGDVMLDRYWHGATERVSPEAPVPVVKVQKDETRLGGAANVALNIVSLTAQAALLGLCGTDDNAILLDRALKKSSIINKLTCIEQKPTITKLRILSRDQQLIRLDHEQNFGIQEYPLIKASLQATLADYDVVIFSDYAKGTLHNCAELIAICKQAGKKVIVDPKSQDFAVYQGADLLTPNMKEFQAVVGPCADDEDIVAKALPLLQQYQLGGILVTRGKEGMTLVRQNEPPLHLPTKAQEVYDVTGAGDTVIAVLATAVAAGINFHDAATLANEAAGLVVAKLGTATISLQELSAAHLERALDNRGVLSAQEFLKIRGSIQAQGKRLVMTNGCFDILHQGHVDYLQKAKALGDFLLVAINSDDSVTRLKGPTRPINPLTGRAEVLAALKAVDWVVAFDSDTPEELIASILPDVLVKGGDYQVQDIAGHRQVLANGGEVLTIDLVPGCATSNVVAKIKQGSTEAGV